MKNDIKNITLLWDFDGTLVDTTEKNYRVTKRILASFPESRKYSNLSRNEYAEALAKSRNWHELYRKRFGLNDEQALQAGKLWKKYQMEDNAEITLFAGMHEFLVKTSFLKQGIVSQNSKDNIVKILNSLRIEHIFDSVIGFEQVKLEHQKPHPEGILNCLKELDISQGLVYYLGDNEIDILTAYNAKPYLNNKMKIKTISVHFNKNEKNGSWQIQPDFSVQKVKELYDIIGINK